MQDQIKKWYFTWWGILMIIIISLILILLAAFGFSVINASRKIKSGKQEINFTPRSYSEEDRKKIEGEGSYWIGSANPKITIVEFADFACPHCGSAYGKIREIGLNYKNDVKIIYRNFAVADSSQIMAMAVQCAGEQGLFWLMHDKLFQNQNVSDAAGLTALANQIGADTKKFSACMSANKYQTKIQKDLVDADGLGVTGTPTWFINGSKVEGDIPYDIFIKIIEEMIKK